MKQFLLTMALIAFLVSAQAQTFSPAFHGFSKKKTTYITKKDGTELTGRLKSLSWKKGLIKEIKFEDIEAGKKVKIKPEDIDHMYVPPSAMAKLAQKMDAATDLTKIRDNELSSEHLEDGYLYMESSKVQIKKKKVMDCMLQVVNPTFSGKIKVYNDPFAKESAAIGVGGMTLAGGLDKSYYIKKEGETIAKKIRKKDYKKDMAELFPECPELLSKYAANPDWSEFEKFIYDYSTMCK
ncbi:hypothetical protein [Fulvivirga sediminis]|uniref:DUF4412 domain-containing protein n=1 Tax=Fulvivirga sediminis TaxID=2803949 RepID=A0A937F9W1_9BACT|nr:hypothetical protein [Fulvivirga sediminis]MBL3658370.1 hypothetical protein [Fulvivirga sediminis]